MSIRSAFARIAFGFLLLCTATLAASKPLYGFEVLPFGDTGRPVDINDRGDIVYCCFYDNGYYSSFAGNWVLNYEGLVDGVIVTDINNLGDLLGSVVTANETIPTIWINGVPHDLRDPQNAHLHFNYDSGPKAISNFDMDDFEILGLPTCWDNQGCVYTGYGYALRTSRSDYIISFGNGSPFDAYAILRNLPEPPASALVLSALLLMSAAQYARRRARPTL